MKKKQCEHQDQLSLIFDVEQKEIDIEIENTLELRHYQLVAVKKVIEHLANKKNTLLYFPTGGGKTEAAISIVLSYISKRKKVLFVANRNELVIQTRERFLKYKIGTGVIQGDRTVNIEHHVQILSIDSFKNREQLIKALDFDLVIIDEAHNHFNNRAYKLYELFQGSKTVFLGLSATPFLQSKWTIKDKLPEFWLGDKTKPTYKVDPLEDDPSVFVNNYYYKSFGYVYDEIVAEVLPHQLRDMGYLVNAEVYHYDILDQEDLELNADGSDYTEESMKVALVTHETVAHIANEYAILPMRDDGDRMQGLAFCISIEHSKMLVEALLARQINAVHIDCYTPPVVRKQIFNHYRERLIDVICSVDVVSEGFDMPQAEVGLACRPTMSLIKVIQQLGRLLRTSPHTGKTKCIILDQANNCTNIISRYLPRDEPGFHPFDPITLDSKLLLAITPPPPPALKEEGEGDGGGARKDGKLGSATELRPYSERQTIRIINTAKQEEWNEEQVKRTFRRTCLFPTSEAVILIADHLEYSPEESAQFYYECGVYSAHFLGMTPGKSATQHLNQMTMVDIQREAQAFYRECDRLLREKRIVPDFSPPENQFFLQLRAAAQKFNKRNESPYPKALYLTLRRVIEVQLRRCLNDDDRLIIQNKLDCLNSQYEAVRNRYKRVRKADARPVSF
jgi:superfamily II DNA or RNA helicase